jgi:bacterial/archaeal transporter family-2 protein
MFFKILGLAMSKFSLLLIIFVSGVLVALQPSINARLAQKIGLVESSTVSFLVGTIALFLLALASGQGSFRALTQVSWWELTGGLMGAFFVCAVILVVPRLGTGAVMAVAIAGQLLTALILDQFQLFGFREIPITVSRISGALLMLLGTWLIVRN